MLSSINAIELVNEFLRGAITILLLLVNWNDEAAFLILFIRALASFIYATEMANEFPRVVIRFVLVYATSKLSINFAFVINYFIIAFSKDTLLILDASKIKDALLRLFASEIIITKEFKNVVDYLIII